MLGESTVHTLIQCTPLLVEKAGVEPYVTLRFMVHKEVRVQADFEIHREGHTKSKIWEIRSYTKWSLVQKIFKKLVMNSLELGMHFI